jgi:hypothetical protein
VSDAVGFQQGMTKLTWLEDADGDVFRRLAAGDFDFEEPCRIDFIVDFDAWPPPAEFLQRLRTNYPAVEVFEPDGNAGGYVLFVVEARLTYELVTFVQSAVSAMAAPFGGTCNAWGVLH